MKNHPSASLRFQPKPDYTLEPDSPRNQVALRHSYGGSNTRNDVQIQTTTSGPKGKEADEIRVGCRLELPYSVGNLTLTSADPKVQPRLDYQFLTDPRDVERLREAVRGCAALFQHSAFVPLIQERLAPTDAQLASNDELEAWLRQDSGIAGHTCSTCKMGPASDPMAVVDQHCRVHGLEGLRVIDAASMPDIPRSNTNATVIMMAERAADLIKAQS